MADHNIHSNPLAPSDDEMEDDDRAQGKLSNDDFRKLLMTPRVLSSSSSTPQVATPFAKPKPVEKKDSSDANNARKKKKSYYAQLKKEEDEREKELAIKYRDRAKERRDCVSSDIGQSIDVSTTANYKAVAPDARIGQSLAERRKQVIEESKYLGGDMEHTHLVKGLDYALLEKVKAEIAAKEIEEMETEINKSKDREEEDSEETITFRTKLGRNIVRSALCRRGPIERNDLFLPGRMTYVFDLDDPYEDLPTTIIRSKADCAGLESSTTLSNNDIVINKLTQILSYLRQGKGRDNKKKKDRREKSRKEEEMIEKVHQNIDIFDDVEDDRSHGKHRRHEASRNDRREMEAKRSYFEKPSEEESKFDETGPKVSAKDLIKNINERYGKGAWVGVNDDDTEKPKSASKDQQDKINKFNSRNEIESYAECYPGMMEMVDALGDSDDEADYTKMDQGNKKGPVGRWDFDSQEEYSNYMSSKEALPKAAFQYGVKMADGRKTRRAGPRDEKKEYDSQWTKIQSIISSKRKGDHHHEGRGGSSSKKIKL